MKRIAAAAALILLASVPAHAEDTAARVHISGVVKAAYTHRDRDSSSGVEAVDEFGLRWAGLYLSDPNWTLELGTTLYPDPITGGGGFAESGPGELGLLGVRQAYIEIGRLIPLTEIKFGTFIPPWGVYRERGVGQWDFADLPFIYYHGSFRGLGWQNTGLEVEVNPLGQGSGELAFTVFAVNGYFPDTLANAQSPLADPGSMSDFGLGGRVLAGIGLARFYGGYYLETFGRDMKGTPALETYQAIAWIAGFEVRGAAGFILAEWQDLTIGDYQLMTGGRWEDWESAGGHASAGINFLDRFTALARADYIDPNTGNSGSTLPDSRHDEVLAYTFGLNYKAGDFFTVKLNYVLPRENGKMIDTAAGRVGGPYTGRDDNYLRLQLELVF